MSLCQRLFKFVFTLHNRNITTERHKHNDIKERTVFPHVVMSTCSHYKHNDITTFLCFHAYVVISQVCLPVRAAILVSYALGFTPRPLSSFDTHPRWPPVTQSARSRRSYGKIGDCEQSTIKLIEQ